MRTSLLHFTHVYNYDSASRLLFISCLLKSESNNTFCSQIPKNYEMFKYINYSVTLVISLAQLVMEIC